MGPAVKVDLLDELQRVNNLFEITKNLLTVDFVDMQFLEYRLMCGSNPLKLKILWSPEPNREILQMKALKFVVEVHDEEPQIWLKGCNKTLQAGIV